MIDWEQRYLEAESRERFIRDAAYTGATERICGFRVKPLTLRHVMALRTIGSPFMCGGRPTVEDAAVFLWCLSPDYGVGNHKAKRKLEKECRKQWRGKPVNFWEAVQEIQAFREEAYMDSPCHSSSGDGGSFFSEAAGICDEIGDAYGWDINTTMDTPLKQLFQQLKIVRNRQRAQAGKVPIWSNPSDRLIGACLSEETEGACKPSEVDFSI